MAELTKQPPKQEDPDVLFAELEQAIRDSGHSMDLGRVRAAYACASLAHSGQLRKDGSPYVTHTVSAARITVEMGLDEDSVVAALLHDVIEDTSLTYTDIARQFGTSVADIVEGVTKLTRVQYTSKEDEQMENLRKMLIAMAKDIRVILIKIADRLHNMRTMVYQTPDKQRSKSLETMEIYAPIAHRLGMQRVKWELEDLSLLYLDPVGYQEIVSTLDNRRSALEHFMAQTEKKITDRLADWGIKATVYGRLKHIYSIYRKMYAQKKGIEEIFDLCAFRVIVDSIADCYNVLGHIHDMYRPIPGRFKDYISTSKPNGYQSVHTTVIGPEGIPFEVQIRTWEMHRVAEYGVAAHWKYKSGDSGVKVGDEEKFAWVRRLLEAQQDSEAQDFVSGLKIDMFADEVFVFTPGGDVINLPAGATPVDFAYSIHTAVGNSMVGAKVNGRIVPIDHVLQNGDIVDITTSKTSNGPSRDWLKIAKSGSTRTKIKQWFKREKREENIVQGRAMFESELKRAGLTVADITDPEVLPQVLKKLAVTDLDDVYASIGYGGTTAVRTVNRIRDEVARIRRPQQRNALDKLNEAAERRAQKETKAVQGVLVEGLDNCLIKFSRCCTPVPGDPIVGFITRGYGVSIHRQDCENYRRRLEDGSEASRWIKVDWAEKTNDHYSTLLRIFAQDRSALVMDIASVLTAMNARVTSLSARVSGGSAEVSVKTEVGDLAELQTIMNRLGGIRGVSEVLRGG